MRPERAHQKNLATKPAGVRTTYRRTEAPIRWTEIVAVPWRPASRYLILEKRLTTMNTDELNDGDEVVIPWGVTEVHGRVAEVFGPPAQRRVIVALEPEHSSYVVDAPTTVSVPISDVKKVVAAG